MNKNFLISLIVVVVVIGGALAFYFLNPGGSSNSDQPSASSPENGSNNSLPSINTRTAAPANIQVPEVDSVATPQNVARPETATQAAPDSNSKIRTFEIMVSGNKFSPDTIAVNQRDTIKISFTAGDKDYDFTQPDYGMMNYELPKGQVTSLEFSASAKGKFTFYCGSCGGPEKGPVGYIVVK